MNYDLIADLKAKAKAILEENKVVLETMDELKEWDSLEEFLANIDKIRGMIKSTVAAIEKAAREVIGELTSAEKLEAAVEVIKAMIPMPKYLDFFAGGVIRMLLSWAVSELNELLDKVWPEEEMDKLARGGGGPF